MRGRDRKDHKHRNSLRRAQAPSPPQQQGQQQAANQAPPQPQQSNNQPAQLEGLPTRRPQQSSDNPFQAALAPGTSIEQAARAAAASRAGGSVGGGGQMGMGLVAVARSRATWRS